MARLVNCTFKFLIYADEKKKVFYTINIKSLSDMWQVICGRTNIKKKCRFFEVYHAALTIYETCDFDLNVIV